MFGIGLPELILILGIALIVVGPEKLPEMAKSIAKVVLDLKKTALDLKESLHEEMHEDTGQQKLEDASTNLLSTSTSAMEVSEIDVVSPPDADPVIISAEAEVEAKQGKLAG